MRRKTGEDQSDAIVRALKKVPAKSLKIIELANSIPIKDGTLDYEELGKRQPEVNLAVVEAKMYGTHTVQAVEALKKVKARSGNVGP